GALLDANEDRWVGQNMLNYWANTFYRAGFEPPDATLAEFDPSLAPELPDASCPYVGLNAFGEGDQDRFFGRQRMVEELVQELTYHRLLSAVGPSGSGKSSLIHAGLVLALKSGALPDSQNWYYFAPIVPGANPLTNLATSLARMIQPSNASVADWI